MLNTYRTTVVAIARAARRKVALMAAAAALALIGSGLTAAPGPTPVTFSYVGNPFDFGASAVGDHLEAIVTLACSQSPCTRGGYQADDALNLSPLALWIDEPYSAAARSEAAPPIPNRGDYGSYITIATIAANDSVTNWALSAAGSGAYKHLQETTFASDP